MRCHRGCQVDAALLHVLLLLLLVDLSGLLALLMLVLEQDLHQVRLRVLGLKLHDFTRVEIAPIGDLHERLDVLEDALLALLAQVLREVLLQVVLGPVALKLLAQVGVLLLFRPYLDPVHLVEPGNILFSLVSLVIDAVKDALQKKLVVFA